MNFQLGIERLIELFWFATAFAIFRTFYCAIRMMPHVKEGYRYAGGGFGWPIGLPDRAFTSDTGKRYRNLFHRWGIYSFLFAVAGMLTIYIDHRIWPVWPAA